MLGGYSIYTHLIQLEALHASFHTGDMAFLDEYLLDSKLTKSFPFSLNFPLDLRCPEPNLKPNVYQCDLSHNTLNLGYHFCTIGYFILLIVLKAAWNSSESEKVYHG